MGTELQRRGAAVALPLWSAQALLDCPELVLQIHQEYVQAGAQVVTANTFRTQRRTLEKAGKDRAAARRLTTRAVQLAREAAVSAAFERIEGRDEVVDPREGSRGGSSSLGSLPGSESQERVGYRLGSLGGRVLVAGSVAPLEDCYRPDLSPGAADDEFQEMADWLMEAGSDLLLIETMNNLTEMRSAIRGAQRAGAEFWVSVNPSNDDPVRLLSGELVGEALKIAYNEGASAFLVNCAAIEVIERAIEPLVERARIPLGCYANNGVPDETAGWRFDREVPPFVFAEHAERMAAWGVAIIGGCCGTTPEHIRAMAEVVFK